MKTKEKKKRKRTNRTAMVLVRLTPEERAKMTAEAETKGLGISAWMRMAAFAALERSSAKQETK